MRRNTIIYLSFILCVGVATSVQAQEESKALPPNEHPDLQKAKDHYFSLVEQYKQIKKDLIDNRKELAKVTRTTRESLEEVTTVEQEKLLAVKAEIKASEQKAESLRHEFLKKVSADEDYELLKAKVREAQDFFDMQYTDSSISPSVKLVAKKALADQKNKLRRYEDILMIDSDEYQSLLKEIKSHKDKYILVKQSQLLTLKQTKPQKKSLKDSTELANVKSQKQSLNQKSSEIYKEMMKAKTVYEKMYRSVDVAYKLRLIEEEKQRRQEEAENNNNLRQRRRRR